MKKVMLFWSLVLITGFAVAKTDFVDEIMPDSITVDQQKCLDQKIALCPEIPDAKMTKKEEDSGPAPEKIAPVDETPVVQSDVAAADATESEVVTAETDSEPVKKVVPRNVVSRATPLQKAQQCRQQALIDCGVIKPEPVVREDGQIQGTKSPRRK